MPFRHLASLLKIFRSPDRAAHLIVGEKGERAAEAFLKKSGYRILGRNVRVGKDEVDILAYDPGDGVLVFAEVKARSNKSKDFGPLLNASAKKRERLRRGARRWVAQHDYQDGYRIDLICVEQGEITQHIKEMGWEE